MQFILYYFFENQVLSFFDLADGPRSQVENLVAVFDYAVVEQRDALVGPILAEEIAEVPQNVRLGDCAVDVWNDQPFVPLVQLDLTLQQTPFAVEGQGVLALAQIHFAEVFLSRE